MRTVYKILFLMCIITVLSVNVFCLETVDIKDEKYFDGKSLSEYCDTIDLPRIKGYSAYAINLNTGTVVYEKNSVQQVFPASTAKLMTAIVAYENIPDLDIRITISKDVVRNASGVNMALKVGEVFTARELLYGLLVRGANDAALLIAEHVAGTEKDFCKLMNDKAKEIGAYDTNFENVTGFHTPNTVTTARDTALIARYLYYIPALFEITDTTRYVIEPTPITNERRTLINRNMLISRVISEKYYYPGSHGMSLGSTPEGGECIVSTVTDKNNLTYLCVVMNSVTEDDTNYACVDIAEIFDFCTGNFALQTVTSASDIITEIPVKLAANIDHVALFPQDELVALLPIDFDYLNDISIDKRIYKEHAYAPLFAGDVLGEIVVKYKENALIGRTSLVASTSIDKSNLLYMLNRIEKIFTSIWFKVFIVTMIILFILYFIISVIIKVRKSKYYGRK